MTRAPRRITTRSARTHPRAVLLAVLLFILLSSGVFLAGPWILPVRIIEGPLVQQPAESGATLVWYTTRALTAGECRVAVSVDNRERNIAADADGPRNRARLDGLAAGRTYPYRITYGIRTLAEGTLHTNRPAGQPFSFVVFGDSGTGNQEQYQLAARMEELPGKPDFLLHTGDLVYTHGQREGFKDRFFVPYRRLLADIPFWPSLGNHDVAEPGRGQPYLDVFELPENGPVALTAERNCWFDYAGARFAVVDSNADEPTLREQVAPWLRSVLAGPFRWKFVAFHHPPYTAGAHAPSARVQRTLVPVFDAAGVDIVFCGHDHLYERMLPMRGGEVAENGNGVVYIVTGAGGGKLYEALPQSSRPAYLSVLENQHYSFTYVRIDGPTLRLQQIATDGSVLDAWTKDKAAPTSQAAPVP